MSTYLSKASLLVLGSLVGLGSWSASGCSAGSVTPDGAGANVTGTGGGNNPNGSGSTGNGSGNNGGGLNVNNADCGDGNLDTEKMESCDDGNKVTGDGCTENCQIEADWECLTPGQPCVNLAACGNSLLTSTEACDDGNAVAGDGCSADCSMVEAGYQCRVAGRACVPLCGDSVLTGAENCDDGNNLSDDGCSSTCLTEPGYTCDTPGQACTASVCGNGMKEAGESCDLGEKNGLFLGDATGCSKTCTNEPKCRNDAGMTTACTTACGDGNIDTGEECDDGNAVSGDGCSDACVKEGGFICEPLEKKDTSDCSDSDGECLVLPITYRDFDGQNVTGGHPDFFFLGAGSTVCVPNASGQEDPSAITTSACWDSDSTDLCPGLVQASLGADGKPQMGSTTECNCRFTDWSPDDNGPTGVIPNANTCDSGGAESPPRYEGMATVIDSAASFAQWFNDDASVNTTVTGTLELAAIGGELYQYSSSDGDTVYDDIRGNGELVSGFFPLEDQARPKVCNIWPYWVANPGCTAGDGDPVKGQWDPSANDGAGEQVTGIEGIERNFYFTTEVRYLFRFQGGESLSFFGDDDVFVFINGVLALDLGAPHERLQGTVVLPTGAGGGTYTITAVDPADGTPVPVGSGTSGDLGLSPGNIYEIAIFHADRHPRESNYQLTLQGFTTVQSACKPECGDGVATTGEECDDGPANDDTLYGGCTTECHFGPFCGDGEPNGPEECDAGRDNGVQYGTAGACTAGCLNTPFCGDGQIDAAFGEECDEEDDNGVGRPCTETCKIGVK